VSEEAVEGKVVKITKEDLALDPMSGARALGMTDEESAFLYSKGTGKDLAEDDPYRRIIDQILSAETPDAVLTPIEARKLSEFIGVPLLLFGYQLQKSEYDVGTPFYAAMECQEAETKEPVVITSGHKKVLAQLVKLRQFDQFPYQVMPCARGTGAGGDPLYELGKWPQDYTPGSGHTEPPPF
jgi:hypothetical protein